MPAPVRSRSAFTSPAEICAASMSAHLLVGSCGLLALLGRLHVGLLLAARPVQVLGVRLLVALLALGNLARGRRLAGLRLGTLARAGRAGVVLGARGRRRGGIGVARKRRARGLAGAGRRGV